MDVGLTTCLVLCIYPTVSPVGHLVYAHKCSLSYDQSVLMRIPLGIPGINGSKKKTD